MSDSLDLRHEEEDGEGGFYLYRGDEKVGEMTYERRDDDVLVFPHTWVDDSLRGEGRARELLDAAVEWVRAEGLKIEPVCPYVVGQFEKDESLRDIRA